MKRSRQVQLSLVSAMAAILAPGCSRRISPIDPCQPETFNPQACEAAVQGGGYFYQGRWFPHTYTGGYSYYFDNYHSYTSRGGRVSAPPLESYRPSGPGKNFTHSSGSSSSPSSSGISRGGFGGSSSGHSSGGSSFGG